MVSIGDLCGGQLECGCDVVAVGRREVLLTPEASLQLAQLLVAERRPRLTSLPTRPETLGSGLDRGLMVPPLLVLHSLTARRH